ncbi:MAG: Gfo/Idh/MocA family oxidoreductase [Chloroflexi bacterium]|nr:Gfo/Idh/MocA family oxidoreductase [Chloroflexota bacterium]
MSDLKIVIIGAGFAARIVHLPGYKGNDEPVAAICDLIPERAQSLADQYGIPRVYADWREMIEKERPDVASVCVANALHRDITIAALEAGAHVLCEKPLATSVAEAHEMFDAARKAGRVLMAAQFFRFTAEARAIRRVVEDGALGEIYHGEASAMRRLGIPTWGAFHQKSASAGGALFDIGVHILDQTVWLMGNPRPVRVSAVTQQRFGRRPEIAAILRNAWDPERFDVEDFAIAFVRFDNGADLVLRSSWAAHIRELQYFNSLVLGTEGGVTTNPPALFHLRNGVLASEEFKDLPPANGYEAEVRAFLRAVRGEREAPVKEEETLNVQRILNGAYRSAAEGREVEVEE